MPITEAVKVPKGIDAAVVWIPQRFIGPQLGISETILDTDGYTGKAAARPGIRVEEVKKSWAYPEGYNTDRLYAFASEKFLLCFASTGEKSPEKARFRTRTPGSRR